MARDTVVWVNAKTLDKAMSSARNNSQYSGMTVTRGKLDPKKKPVKRLRALGYRKYKIYLRKRKR